MQNPVRQAIAEALKEARAVLRKNTTHNDIRLRNAVARDATSSILAQRGIKWEG